MKKRMKMLASMLLAVTMVAGNTAMVHAEAVTEGYAETQVATEVQTEAYTDAAAAQAEAQTENGTEAQTEAYSEVQAEETEAVTEAETAAPETTAATEASTEVASEASEDKAEALTQYTLTGWFNEGPDGAIKAVKVNGVELSQTEGTLLVDPDAALNVTVSLNDGYYLGGGFYEYLFSLGTVDSHNMTNSQDGCTVEVPGIAWLDGTYGSDNELYLYFCTGEDPQLINQVELTVTAPECGTVVTGNEWIGDNAQRPQPQVTLPDDAGYQLDTNYGNYGGWYKTTEGQEMFEGTMTGGESYYAYVDLRITNYPQLAYRVAQTTEYNRFGMDPEVTVNGATLVEKWIYDDETIGVLVEVPIEHVAGDTVRENEKKPLCLADGSHDEVVYCTKCSAEMSRKTVVIR